MGQPLSRPIVNTDNLTPREVVTRETMGTVDDAKRAADRVSGGGEVRVATQGEVLQERERAAARERLADDGPKLDTTVPGGRYTLDDGNTIVDADGKVLGKHRPDEED